MNREEFIYRCSHCGYSTKENAKKWCDNNPKEEYSSLDYQEVYSFNERNTSYGVGNKWRYIEGCRTTKTFDTVMK